MPLPEARQVSTVVLTVVLLAVYNNYQRSLLGLFSLSATTHWGDFVGPRSFLVLLNSMLPWRISLQLRGPKTWAVKIPRAFQARRGDPSVPLRISARCDGFG